MRSYKEYYAIGQRHYITWLGIQKEEWWKKGDNTHLDIAGDYIETVRFLSNDEKNDSSLFINHTNVKNSEWDILFSMLGQALIDWCIENQETNWWSYGMHIIREVENIDSIYLCNFSVRDATNQKITDEETLKKFEGCRDFLCDIVEQFISDQGKDIPNNWNSFVFSLDDLKTSCKFGEWVADSDGYLSFGAMYEGSDDEYEEYVELM